MDNGSCNITATPECVYPDGTFCKCGAIVGTNWTWNCFLPMAPCPTLVPNAGTACTTEGAGCAYENCKLETTCGSGVWQWQVINC
jgi:hypothetical protein